MLLWGTMKVVGQAQKIFANISLKCWTNIDVVEFGADQPIHEEIRAKHSPWCDMRKCHAATCPPSF